MTIVTIKSVSSIRRLLNLLDSYPDHFKVDYWIEIQVPDGKKKTKDVRGNVKKKAQKWELRNEKIAPGVGQYRWRIKKERKEEL